ncbi:MAG TPA: hypothetical protein VGH02_09860 [Rhizomicrobium sp.]|jgi:hypothetical protein
MKTFVKTGIGAVVLGTVLASGVLIGEAMAYQEHMHAALDALRTARSELQASEANKGGHRERAMDLVDRAIEQVQAGMDYAR